LKTDSEKKAIADYVLLWYGKFREKHSELEEIVLKEINVEDLAGRFEVILLATLFSLYMMEETRAFNIWRKITRWFKEKEIQYSDVFANSATKELDDFKDAYQIFGVSSSFMEASNFLKYIKKSSFQLTYYKNDLNNLVVPNNWRGTIIRMQNTLTGVSQKAFWIARVMKQKGAWDVPGKYCCVSDSHVKAFLRKAGFVVNVDDLFYNSSVMWKFFNEGRLKNYYDIPVFRFAREPSFRCKKCDRKLCTIKMMKKCRPI
jgi:hypothetical protein